MGHRSLEAARHRLGLTYMDLWIDYFALGGNLAADQLALYLRGTRNVGEFDHNVLTHALNERLHDLGENHPLTYRAV